MTHSPAKPRDSWAARHDMSGGGQSSDQTTTTTPWGPQGAALQSGYKAAKTNILNRPTEFFPGQTFADFAPQTQTALGLQEDRALGGNPLLGQAQGYTGDVLSGNFLDPATNPFLANVTDSVLSAVRPGVDSQFAGGGRQGSGLHAEALGRGVSRGIAPYLFGEYGRERGIQEQAAGRAPGLAREDYFDIGQLGNVGQAFQGQEQLGINEAMSRFNFGQAEPANRAQQYLQTIQGLPTFGTTTGQGQTQSQVNPLLLGLGAASSLAPMAFGSPIPMGK